MFFIGGQFENQEVILTNGDYCLFIYLTWLVYSAKKEHIGMSQEQLKHNVVYILNMAR